MKDRISNYAHNEKRMNDHDPVNVEEMPEEFTYLREKFSFVTEDLEM